MLILSITGRPGASVNENWLLTKCYFFESLGAMLSNMQLKTSLLKAFELFFEIVSEYLFTCLVIYGVHDLSVQ